MLARPGLTGMRPLARSKTVNNIYVATTGNDTTGNGTAGNPYATIAKADSVATPGTVINVASGSYNGGFHTTASGTAKNKITFKSTTKQGAKIVIPAGSASDTAWDSDGDWVVIDGFEVDGSAFSTGTQWRFGIYVRGSNVTVQNCKVHHIGTTGLGAGAGAAGLYAEGFYGDQNIDFLYNVVYLCGTLAGDNTMHCIYHATVGGNIKNNLAYKAAGWGITTFHDAQHINIVNNTVFSCISGGISVAGGSPYKTAGVADYMYVANNISYSNTAYGIIESNTTGTHNVYVNNCSFSNPTANWQLQNGLTHTGDVNASPSFVNFLADGTGDYHLANGSPCIDTGVTPATPVPLDLDGVARPKGAGYDMGCYEK